MVTSLYANFITYFDRINYSVAFNWKKWVEVYLVNALKVLEPYPDLNRSLKLVAILSFCHFNALFSLFALLHFIDTFVFFQNRLILIRSVHMIESEKNINSTSFSLKKHIIIRDTTIISRTNIPMSPFLHFVRGDWGKDKLPVVTGHSVTYKKQG